jgi:hypothetical protein
MALVALQHADRIVSPTRDTVAQKIIELAKAGERDPGRLCDAALEACLQAIVTDPSPPSASRFTAGAAGFLNLSQSGDLARGHATAVLPAATMKVPPPYAGHGDFLRPNTKPAEHRGRWGSVRLERISRVAQ